MSHESVSIHIECHPSRVGALLRDMLSSMQVPAAVPHNGRETFTGYPHEVVEPRRTGETLRDKTPEESAEIALEKSPEVRAAEWAADKIASGTAERPAGTVDTAGAVGGTLTPAAPAGRAKRATKAEMEARKQAAAEASLDATPPSAAAAQIAAQEAGFVDEYIAPAAPSTDGVTYDLTDSVLRELVMEQNRRVGAPLLKSVNDYLAEVRVRMTDGGEAAAAGELKNMLGLSPVDREALVTRILDLPNGPSASEAVVASVAAKTQALLDAAVKL